jgi:hypothetical protein
MLSFLRICPGTPTEHRRPQGHAFRFNFNIRACVSKLILIVVDFGNAGMMNAVALNSSSAGRSRQVMSLDFSAESPRTSL